MDLKKIKFPPLHEDVHDREEIKKAYYRQNGEIAVKNLKKNNFQAYYCHTMKDAKDQTLALVPDESTIGFGDSHTIFSLELEEALAYKDCISIPYPCAVNATAFKNKLPGFKILGNEEETRKILMEYMAANVFMLGANAITMDGQIINIDGAGNRIAASIFGPDRIIVIAGANKLVRDVEAGLIRIRDVGAQMNNIKYEQHLSCNETGSCQECSSEERNCNVTAIYHKKPVAADFHVIVIGEELGF